MSVSFLVAYMRHLFSFSCATLIIFNRDTEAQCLSQKLGKNLLIFWKPTNHQRKVTYTAQVNICHIRSVFIYKEHKKKKSTITSHTGKQQRLPWGTWIDRGLRMVVQRFNRSTFAWSKKGSSPKEIWYWSTAKDLITSLQTQLKLRVFKSFTWENEKQMNW